MKYPSVIFPLVFILTTIFNSSVAQESAGRTTHFLVAGGADLMSVRDGDHFTPHVLLEFGVVLGGDSSRYSFRLTGLYKDQRRSPDDRLLYTGLNAEVTRDFNTGRTRFYSMMGVGLYRLYGRQYFEFGYPDPYWDIRTKWTAAALVGLGVSHPINGGRLFAEIRGFGYTNGLGITSKAFPLTVGFRF